MEDGHWKVIDNIVGEITEVDSYEWADEIVRAQLSYHTSTFMFGRRCHHIGVECVVTKDEAKHTLTIDVKRN